MMWNNYQPTPWRSQPLKGSSEFYEHAKWMWIQNYKQNLWIQKYTQRCTYSCKYHMQVPDYCNINHSGLLQYKSFSYINFILSWHYSHALLLSQQFGHYGEQLRKRDFMQVGNISNSNSQYHHLSLNFITEALHVCNYCLNISFRRNKAELISKSNSSISLLEFNIKFMHQYNTTQHHNISTVFCL